MIHLVTANSHVLKRGSCDEQVVLSSRLENTENSIIAANPKPQSGRLHARYSLSAVQCVTIAILFWFGEHESGMEVQHTNGMKSHQQSW